ncbi:hypothetical protein P5673_019508 [Acropora cervicornis]|uniref:Uncharacterized protein n=1 Tax=Acropora cervicornis TaxID=6130 RepID=A0AAD9V254_ACRCE|nr:hypothetical protein P5673_019508 [Acropora cervicornis]
MAVPYPPYAAAHFVDDTGWESLFGRKCVPIPKYFDPNLVFFGAGDAPLQLCQRLMDAVVNSPNFMTVRPSISLLSMIPEIMEELPGALKDLQLVAFGKKYNWKLDELEGVFYVTNYDSMRLDGIKKQNDIAVEEFLEFKNIPRSKLYGVIFQHKEPLWLSPLRSAEIFNFKKRLADVLHVKTDNIFWIQNQQHISNLLSAAMSRIYRWREDKESEENKKIVHGKIALSNEEMQKELLEPTTMLYGELAEKDGIVLAEGV